MIEKAAELHAAFSAALARSPRDASRYSELSKTLAAHLEVAPVDVAIKSVASVSADLRNRIGEVTQRRQPAYIIIVLDPELAAIEAEVERAQAEIVRAYSERRLSSTIILFTKRGPAGIWAPHRVIERGQVTEGTMSLITELGLANNIVNVVPVEEDSLPARASKVWLEFTRSDHNHGGQGWEFGTCLWSPTTDRDGKNRYGVMRLPAPGDRVIHALDSRVLGTSVVAKPAIETDKRPLEPGAWGWADRFYRIELANYRPIDQPLAVNALISKRFAEILADIRGNSSSYYPFCEHSGSIRIVQGAYLTAVPESLLKIIETELALTVGSAASTNDAKQTLAYSAEPEEELVIDSRDLDLILQLWFSRKNIILEGPPGVGKTVLAHQLARTVVDGDVTRICSVQFHQSYSYEDFVLGWRPGTNGEFALEDGVFKYFCGQASKKPHANHVFMIDEINRGNVARIFGELLTLIERDKRSPRHSMPLLYGEPPRPPFFVPPNVYVIGMMNTADRSLAVVDYALRRRFAFYMLEPLYGDSRYVELLIKRGMAPDLAKQIDDRFADLNKEIIEDRKNLGPGFAIGHSYFIPRNDSTTGPEWYNEVINREIGPLLREYWFDRPEHAEGVIKKLLA